MTTTVTRVTEENAPEEGAPRLDYSLSSVGLEQQVAIEAGAKVMNFYLEKETEVIREAKIEDAKLMVKDDSIVFKPKGGYAQDQLVERIVSTNVVAAAQQNERAIIIKDLEQTVFSGFGDREDKRGGVPLLVVFGGLLTILLAGLAARFFRPPLVTPASSGGAISIVNTKLVPPVAVSSTNSFIPLKQTQAVR